jgi:hypothetical protein
MSIIESLAGTAIWSGVAAPQETLSGGEISGVNK